MAQAGPPALQQDPNSTKLYDLAAREAQYHALAAMPGAEVEYGKFGRLRAAAQRRGARVFGWVCSVLVFLIALFFIYIGMNAVHALPVWLQMSPQI